MGIFDRMRSAERPMPSAPATFLGRPRFAVIDVETTGLSAAQHRIVEIAVVTTDPWGRVLEEWSSRINPEGPVGATHIHGISQADVARAPRFADVMPFLTSRLAGAAIAAHNARFDVSFLAAEYARAGWDMPAVPTLCTLRVSDQHLPNLDRRRLTDCCWAVGVPLTDHHSALGDARATAGLLSAFMNPHVGLPPRPSDLNLPAAALSVAWPVGPGSSPAPGLAPVAPATQDAPRRRVAQATVAPPSSALVELVERFSLVDALDEGAPEGSIAYLEKVAEVLEDGEITLDEAAELTAVAAVEELSESDVASAHRAFVLALAHAALDDGKVSRAERAELQQVAKLLGVSPRSVTVLLERAETARNERMSVGLSRLPDGWAHGEPLRVGDKVVFTGCSEAERGRLEQRSEELGVRVVGSVSAKTSILVSDGTMQGAKHRRALELGTRTVHPDVYTILLSHLQPAGVSTTRSVAASGAPDDTAAPVPVVGRPGPAGVSPAVVRAWARANGHVVGTRGRLHPDLLAAYEAAHSS